jgi:hypothetical protein
LEEFERVACADGVAEEAVDEAGVLEDGGGKWSLGGDGKVGEEASFRVREGARHEMEGRNRDDRVAQTAKTVDEHAGRVRGASLEEFGHIS